MNSVIEGLKIAIKNIKLFYYEIPNLVYVEDELVNRNNYTTTYERSFISQLKSELDLIKNQYFENNKYTQVECPKEFCWGELRDEKIYASYIKLESININLAHNTIDNLPNKIYNVDFCIHESQSNHRRQSQLLVLEAKTTNHLTNSMFNNDLFRLNIFVEKYNFQNAVF